MTHEDSVGGSVDVCTAIPAACLTDYTCDCVDPGYSTVASDTNYCAESGGVIRVNVVAS